jgi:hypothetical protein
MQCLFRRLGDEAGEAVLKSLAVLVRGMFGEAVAKRSADFIMEG